MQNELDSYLKNYTNFNSYLIHKRYQFFKQFFRGTHALEIGVGDATGTATLVTHFNHVTVVDGSTEAIKAIAHRYPSTSRHIQNFENLAFPEHTFFHTIILAHVLEHVDDPHALLQRALSFLSPSGVLIVSVPNANSLHRQIGVELNLLKNTTDLNETDLSLGHKRVYTQDEFIKEIFQLPLKPSAYKFGGMFLKVLSNDQTEKTFNKPQLDAMFKVGVQNPSISADLFALIKPEG